MEGNFKENSMEVRLDSGALGLVASKKEKKVVVLLNDGRMTLLDLEHESFKAFST